MALPKIKSTRSGNGGIERYTPFADTEALAWEEREPPISSEHLESPYLNSFGPELWEAPPEPPQADLATIRRAIASRAQEMVKYGIDGVQLREDRPGKDQRGSCCVGPAMKKLWAAAGDTTRCGQPWCGGFVVAALKLAGVTNPRWLKLFSSLHAEDLIESLESEAKQQNRPSPVLDITYLRDPSLPGSAKTIPPGAIMPGDILVIRKDKTHGHLGIVKAFDAQNQKVATLEGNTYDNNDHTHRAMEKYHKLLDLVHPRTEKHPLRVFFLRYTPIIAPPQKKEPRPTRPRVSQPPPPSPPQASRDWDRVTSYDAHILEAARKWGLDPSLIAAVIMAESSGIPNKPSSKGAIGLMQLMPSTARDLVKGKPLSRADLENPALNINLGSRYLKMMLQMFGGDTRKALTAYNWGPGHVKRNGAERAPAGTHKYVEKILKFQKCIASHYAGASPQPTPTEESEVALPAVGAAGIGRAIVASAQDLVDRGIGGVRLIEDASDADLARWASRPADKKWLHHAGNNMSEGLRRLWTEIGYPRLHGKPWCGAFVVAALKRAGVTDREWLKLLGVEQAKRLRDAARAKPTGERSSSSAVLDLRKFTASDISRILASPGALLPGDVVVFPHHLAIVKSYDPQARKLVTLEGNTWGRNGVPQEKAGVSRAMQKTRPLSSLVTTRPFFLRYVLAQPFREELEAEDLELMMELQHLHPPLTDAIAAEEEELGDNETWEQTYEDEESDIPVEDEYEETPEAWEMERNWEELAEPEDSESWEEEWEDEDVGPLDEYDAWEESEDDEGADEEI